MKKNDFNHLEPRLHLVVSLLLNFPSYTPEELKRYLESIDIDINNIYKQLEDCEIVRFTSDTKWKVDKEKAKQFIEAFEKYEENLIIKQFPNIKDLKMKKALYYLNGYELINTSLIQRKLHIGYKEALSLRDSLVEKEFAEYVDENNQNKGVKLRNINLGN